MAIRPRSRPDYLHVPVTLVQGGKAIPSAFWTLAHGRDARGKTGLGHHEARQGRARVMAFVRGVELARASETRCEGGAVVIGRLRG